MSIERRFRSVAAGTAGRYRGFAWQLGRLIEMAAWAIR